MLSNPRQVAATRTGRGSAKHRLNAWLNLPLASVLGGGGQGTRRGAGRRSADSWWVAQHGWAAWQTGRSRDAHMQQATCHAVRKGPFHMRIAQCAPVCMLQKHWGFDLQRTCAGIQVAEALHSQGLSQVNRHGRGKGLRLTFPAATSPASRHACISHIVLQHGTAGWCCCRGRLGRTGRTQAPHGVATRAQQRQVSVLANGRPTVGWGEGGAPRSPTKMPCTAYLEGVGAGLGTPKCASAAVLGHPSVRVPQSEPAAITPAAQWQPRRQQEYWCHCLGVPLTACGRSSPIPFAVWQPRARAASSGALAASAGRLVSVASSLGLAHDAQVVEADAAADCRPLVGLVG